MTDDRNFDGLAERFRKRIYGNNKGVIRREVIWRDLKQQIPDLEHGTTLLSILDLGAGLGQFSIALAKLGHRVSYNDLSSKMMALARNDAESAGIDHAIDWHCGPYQDLALQDTNGYDLILCHALLEWLARPALLLPSIAPLLNPGGHLSLSFYNPVGRIYRNLVFGNFKLVQRGEDYAVDERSLTPTNPQPRERVVEWIESSGLRIQQESGIRVFSDYVLEKRGGHQYPEAVLEMELEYSNQEPYKRLGRYLHIVAKHADDDQE